MNARQKLEDAFGWFKFSSPDDPQTLYLPEEFEDASLEKAWKKVQHEYVLERRLPAGGLVYQPRSSPAGKFGTKSWSLKT